MGAGQVPDLARGLLGDGGAIIEFHDTTRKAYRAARIRDERLEACVYLAAEQALPVGTGSSNS